jgi:hypothetical protein
LTNRTGRPTAAAAVTHADLVIRVRVSSHPATVRENQDLSTERTVGSPATPATSLAPAFLLAEALEAFLRDGPERLPEVDPDAVQAAIARQARLLNAERKMAQPRRPSPPPRNSPPLPGAAQSSASSARRNGGQVRSSWSHAASALDDDKQVWRRHRPRAELGRMKMAPDWLAGSGGPGEF